MEKGLSSFSTDLLADIGYEIGDVYPKAKDVLYAFIGSTPVIGKEKVVDLLSEFDVPKDNADEVFDLLLWHCFLGVNIGDEEAKYIYHFNYNMRLLAGVIRKNQNTVSFSIHPAFWSALMIEGM